MRANILLFGAAIALLGGAAAAQSLSDPTVTTLCLTPTGTLIPPVCHSGSPSRIEQQRDICQCINGGEQVTASFCPKGVAPPPESLAVAKARRSAVNHGSLVGASFEGRPLCVARRDQTGGS